MSGEGEFRRDVGAAPRRVEVPEDVDGDTSLIRRVNALEACYSAALAVSEDARPTAGIPGVTPARNYIVSRAYMEGLRAALKAVRAARP